MTTRFCERCERTTVDGNLWCQDVDCPAGSGFILFDYGDYLGEIKILKLISVWRTAAVYEGQRGKFIVWVKVAHPDPICEERLKREAELLTKLTPARARGLAKFIQSFRPKARPIWLPMLSPYTVKTPQPYGEITVDGVTRAFFVFEPVKGAVLSDALLENPQVWHYEASWVTQALAYALAPLTRNNLLHLNLVPQIVLVDVDDQQHWRPTLLDYGWMLDAKAQFPEEIVKRAEPGYLAPEVSLRRASLASDTYALGLIYYEMLAGRPGYEARLRRDGQVREDVERRKALPVNRPELVKARIIEQLENSIKSDPAERTKSVLELAAKTQGIYGPPPLEIFERPIRFYVLTGLLLAVFVIGLIALLALAIQSTIGRR